MIQYFKDDATAFNNQKRAVLEGKRRSKQPHFRIYHAGPERIGVPTHFIRRLNMREQLIRHVEIIPLEVVVRNVAAGTLCKRLGLEDGAQLPRSVIEFYYKNDALGDPLIAEEHITAFNWATPQEIDDMMAQALRINDFLCGLFAGVGIKLVDFKVEFGRQYDGDLVRLILADEISPDSCRLWDMETGAIMDKDRFRKDLGGVTDAYREVAKRLGVLKDNGHGGATGPVLVADNEK
ncbi:MAG: phosphoribosylaminoimidazolesuccinocarboxamide synthase [Parvularculaceae bacterium]